MASDLHVHTTYSDGSFTPEEIIAAAKAANLTYIAITDHDTVDGVRHLYEQGFIPGRGIHIIPGIEFSAHHAAHEVHILGYNIDLYHQGLMDTLNEVTEARWVRFSQMIEKLQKLGYALTEADALKLAGNSRSVSRSHIGRALVAKGYFKTVKEAFAAVLEKGKEGYVSHYRLEPEQIISLIREAGGTSVLAHPKLIHSDALVEELLQMGMEGLEVFYPLHDAADTARYLQLAEKYHVRVAGGSDFHGFPSREPQKLGIFTLEDKYAAQFFVEERTL